MLLAWLFGFLLGFLGSVPVAGPISALVVERGVQGRFKAGAFIALGGGVVEAIYAFLAFWGFSTFLVEYPLIVPISRGAGAVVLLVLGMTFVLKKPADPQAAPVYRDSKRSSFLLGAWICAINPTLIATWSAAVTTLYSSNAIDFEGGHALPFAIGCASGITGWFLLLLGIIRRYRERFSPRALARVVNAIGVLLLGLSIWFAVRFVRYFTVGEPPVGVIAACERGSR
jgi:threonine/homoserine/homoserine lactone efflux protein